jgi:ParB-like chromosome segregation protein Spo0J
MTHYIDTPDQFRQIRAEMKTATITSRRHGPIPVPCSCSLLVRRDMLKANNYNPNSVPRDKMRLLRRSIMDNGFCFPVVTIWDDAEERFVIIDGFHRCSMAGEEWLDLDYVPVVCIEHDISRRMYATVQFNKARGVHQVDLDADVIRALIEQGNSDEEIADHLGMDIDTVHRYKQLTGIAELFATAHYSPAWTMTEVENE